MFGLGFVEIAVVCVLVLIFVRPHELPGLFRSVGRTYGQLTYGMREFVEDIKQIDSGVQVDPNALPKK